MSNLKSMMTRVGNGVNKKQASQAEEVYGAIRRVEVNSDTGKVTLSAMDYAVVLRYVEAIAKKAGVI